MPELTTDNAQTATRSNSQSRTICGPVFRRKAPVPRHPEVEHPGEPLTVGDLTVDDLAAFAERHVLDLVERAWHAPNEVERDLALFYVEHAKVTVDQFGFVGIVYVPPVGDEGELLRSAIATDPYFRRPPNGTTDLFDQVRADWRETIEEIRSEWRPPQRRRG